MTLTLRINGRLGQPHPPAFAFRLEDERGRDVGTVTQLSPTLWVAALDKPPTAVQASSLPELRKKLRGY